MRKLYDAYLANPASVEPAWRDYFDKLSLLPGAGNYTGVDVAHSPVIASFAQRAKEGTLHAPVPTAAPDGKQVKVLQMINAYRFLGNRWAQIDPLKRSERPVIAELEPSHYGFTEADLGQSFQTGSFAALPDTATLREILEALRETYCGAIGSEYMYIADIQQKRWLQSKLEPVRATPSFTAKEKMHFLERITAAETLERYLHTRYVGQKRFSLEGGESTILAMDVLINTAGSMGVQELVIGHGAPWSSQCTGQYPGQVAANAVRRVRGQEGLGVVGGRCQISHGLLVRSGDAWRSGTPHAGIQSFASGNRQSCRRGFRLCPAASAWRQDRRTGDGGFDSR